MKILDLLGLTELVEQISQKFAALTHTHTKSEITDYVVDSALSASSTNPLQNKVVNEVMIAVANDIENLETEVDSVNDALTSHTSNSSIHHTVDTALSSTSTNPVQNKVVQSAVQKLTDEKANKDELGAFYFNITENIDDSYSTDQTYAQIKTAYDNGYTIIGVYNDMVFPLVSAPDGQFIFVITIIEDGTQGSIYFAIASDNTITFRMDTITPEGIGALPDTTFIPTKVSELTNDSGFITSVPVTSVNNKTGAVKLSASDVGADASGSANAVQANLDALNDEFDDHVDNADIHFTASERNKLSGIATGANNYTHPNSGVTAGTYKSVTVNAQGHVTGGTNPTTLSGYGITDAEAKGTVNTHNTSTSAHSDIRLLITNLTTQVENFLDVDDTTKDQLSELIALIEENADSIESITSGKVNVSDIVNNLTTNVSNKPLSAAQGVALKGLIDALQSALDTDEAALSTHTGNTTVHITSQERADWNDAVSKEHTHSNKTVLDNTTASYTTAEKTKLSGIATGAEVNQNAFSNIKVGTTTVAADSETDTVEFAGSNVTITPDATNDKITFTVADGTTSAKGVVQLTNSTSSTSTTTAATPSSVKSAYDLANSANTAATTAQSTADSKADVEHTHTVSEISDLTATATELNYVDGVTSNVQTQLDAKAASSDHKLKTYTSLEQIGLTVGSETIASISNALSVGSEVWIPTNSSNASIYPSTNCFVIARRVSENTVRFDAYSIDKKTLHYGVYRVNEETWTDWLGHLPLTGGTLTGGLTTKCSVAVPLTITKSNKTTADLNWYQDIVFQNADSVRTAVIRSQVRSTSGDRVLILGVSNSSNVAPSGIEIARNEANNYVYAMAPSNDYYGISQLRNIYAGTAALTSGSSSLTSGRIYLQFE